MTHRLIAFPASPDEREPVSENVREHGPSSRINGTAQGKGRPEVLRVQTGLLRKLRSSSRRAGHSDGQRSEGSWPGTQLYQHNYRRGYF